MKWIWGKKINNTVTSYFLTKNWEKFLLDFSNDYDNVFELCYLEPDLLTTDTKEYFSRKEFSSFISAWQIHKILWKYEKLTRTGAWNSILDFLYKKNINRIVSGPRFSKYCLVLDSAVSETFDDMACSAVAFAVLDLIYDRNIFYAGNGWYEYEGPNESIRLRDVEFLITFSHHFLSNNAALETFMERYYKQRVP